VSPVVSWLLARRGVVCALSLLLIGAGMVYALMGDTRFAFMLTIDGVLCMQIFVDADRCAETIEELEGTRK